MLAYSIHTEHRDARPIRARAVPMAALATSRTEDGRKICGDCWRLERGAQ